MKKFNLVAMYDAINRPNWLRTKKIGLDNIKLLMEFNKKLLSEVSDIVNFRKESMDRGEKKGNWVELKPEDISKLMEMLNEEVEFEVIKFIENEFFSDNVTLDDVEVFYV